MTKSEPVSQAIDEFLALCISKSINHIVVALSGGVDSLSLLHALHLARTSDSSYSLSAVYIDHQLQAPSSDWAKQNQRFCESLDIPFQSVQVEVDKDLASLESTARKARYQALSEFVPNPQTCLVTGQHLNDQAETFLLQLFRGAGSKGLASMPKLTDFAQGYLARPLLTVSRKALESYCNSNGLQAIEDPTNQDTDIRRNFVRHQVMPLVEQKWPQASKVIASASEIQADNQQLLDELAAIDFENCYEVKQNSLVLAEVRQLSPQRVRNLLRYWLEGCGADMPSQAVLQQIQTQMLDAKEDANPAIEMSSGSIRRYRDGLYWVTETGVDYAEFELIWLTDRDLTHNEQLLIPLNWLQQNHPHLVGKELMVKGRQGGERIRFEPSKPSISLKNYFQEQGIPPWQRDQVLLLEFEGELRAIFLAR
ncbi:tRNA lysidine(34) synthetase TilS [Kangiella koreensis]|uniref:tRNA(Ile)-lysidine synthase n=1 Tax=Kangiella koreensis (strain DSM 16069 / JCM 12317 / KCTC 12182 / SW-125) TaxID=523791 RepID=C7R5W5_KANKD|nr:tRNA lysidine(34) synthetase TilS [Kangiella koreensis]ACV27289.1 tRNA(Ile)-lysidine synthetase [Kangiella koreensis DSM 16069]